MLFPRRVVVKSHRHAAPRLGFEPTTRPNLSTRSNHETMLTPIFMEFSVEYNTVKITKIQHISTQDFPDNEANIAEIRKQCVHGKFRLQFNLC